jgi:hypothetical protein
MATITLKVVPFHAYAPFPALCHFLNASWKLCSVGVFSTTCNSASIAQLCHSGNLSVLSSIGETEKSRVSGDDCHVVFGKKFSGEKRKCQMVCRRDATVSFVAKVLSEVFANFHAVTIKLHKQNWLFGLPGQLLCEQSP